MLAYRAGIILASECSIFSWQKLWLPSFIGNGRMGREKVCTEGTVSSFPQPSPSSLTPNQLKHSRLDKQLWAYKITELTLIQHLHCRLIQCRTILSNNTAIVYDDVHYDLSDVLKIHQKVSLLCQMIDSNIFTFNK